MQDGLQIELEFGSHEIDQQRSRRAEAMAALRVKLTPTNRILGSLGRGDREMLEPCLEPVTLKLRQRLEAANRRIDSFYFIVDRSRLSLPNLLEFGSGESISFHRNPSDRYTRNGYCDSFSSNCIRNDTWEFH